MSRSLGGAFIFGGCPRVEAAWRELLAGMDTSFSTRLELVGGSDRSSSIVSSSWSEELATVVRVRFCEWRTSDVSDLSEAAADHVNTSTRMKLCAVIVTHSVILLRELMQQ